MQEECSPTSGGPVRLLRHVLLDGQLLLDCAAKFVQQKLALGPYLDLRGTHNHGLISLQKEGCFASLTYG